MKKFFTKLIMDSIYYGDLEDGPNYQHMEVEESMEYAKDGTLEKRLVDEADNNAKEVKDYLSRMVAEKIITQDYCNYLYSIVDNALEYEKKNIPDMVEKWPRY